MSTLSRMSLCVSWIFWASFWPAHAADWPEWGGSPTRNGVASTAHDLPATFSPGRKQRGGLGYDLKTSQNVKWAVRLGSRTFSSPVVSQGRLLIGTNDASLDDPRYESTRGGLLLCLDEQTGQKLWHLVVPRIEVNRELVNEDFDDMNLGICSTPTVVGDRVYLVTNRCEVLCLDLQGMKDGNALPFQDEANFSVPIDTHSVKLLDSDADIVWRFDLLHDLPVFPHDATNCSVLVVGDIVYVVTGNGVSHGEVVLPDAPSLVALDKRTGRLLGREQSGISARTFHGQWSSPALAESPFFQWIILGGGDGFCYGFDRLAGPGVDKPELPEVVTLPEAWRIDANPSEYRLDHGTLIDYWAIVRGVKRKTIESNGRLVAPSEIIGSPTVDQNHVYVTIGQDPLHGPGAGALTCIDLPNSADDKKPRIRWQNQQIGRSMSTVAVHEGCVFAAETAGEIHCLDADDGHELWSFRCGDEIWSSPLIADGKLYLGTRRGLQVLRASRTLEHLATVKLGSAVASAPAAVDHTLFVASQQVLWAVEQPATPPTKAP